MIVMDQVTAMTLNRLIKRIASEDSIYREIMDNIIQPNYHMRDELLSELTIGFYNNEDKVLQTYKEGYFKYYFISAVKNQVHSSSSSFHKNNRQTIANKLSEKMDDIQYHQETNGNDIEDLKLMEKKNEAIQQARKQIKVSWYENEMARLYFDENYTYRQIEDEYGIDHVSVFMTIKKYKDKIVEKLKENGKY